jgi:hemolysin III
MYYGERLNGYTHLAGTMLAAAGAIALVSLAAVRGDPVRIVSFSVYGTTLCLLFLVSTLYHSSQGRAKNVLRKLDYVAIYLVIAGTWTPFALVALKGDWSWTLFGAVWGLAAIGIVQELWIARGTHRLTSVAIYLLMGWIALLALAPLVEALTWSGLAWLVAGGLVYTVGIVFYLYDERFRHWHGIWHLFVLAGSATHYAAIVKFIA